MKIHGEWVTTLVNDVVVRTTAGSFNLEGTIACFHDTQKTAPTDRPWAIFNHAINWEMSNEEALQAYPMMRDWVFSHGCVCIVVIVSTGMRLKIHQKQTGGYSDDQVRYLTDIDEAFAWLNSKGFPFNMADYPHNDFLEHVKKAAELKDLGFIRF